jgi:hypothetical protein
VLNKDAPVPIKVEVKYDAAQTKVVLHLTFNNSDVMLTPDAAKKVFTGTIPAAALTTGLSDADVFRKLIGQIKVTTAGVEEAGGWLFGDVVTSAVPPVTPTALAADVQFTEHLVNIVFPLAEKWTDVTLQLNAICQKFYQHFDDEYDFLQIVLARTHFESRFHGPTRNNVQGIGTPINNDDVQYGSGGRLLGFTIFPYACGFDAGAPTMMHELGHQWINQLKFAPLLDSVPHWPLSDLATDIMGFTIKASGMSGQFDFTLQPLGNGDYQKVPDASPKKYSDLSLYLMGMIPASQVGSHFVFADQAQPLNLPTLKGPVTPLTINDVIAHVGPRVPDASQSQKRFRCATILVSKAAFAPNDMLRLYDLFAARAGAKTALHYSDGFLAGTSHPFRLMTKGAGRLDPRIKRNILIDASRDGGTWWMPQPQQGPFNPAAAHQGKALADHFRALHHRVKELTPPTTITAALLADWDIVVRTAGHAPYGAAEIAAYDAWVKDGGSLLLLSEFAPHDQLAAHFGITFKGTSGGKQLLSQYAAHPLTGGVGPIKYGVGSGITGKPANAILIGSLSPDSFLDLDNNGVKGPGDPAAPAVLGVMPLGLGRIVFCGDVNMWEQVPQPLVKNTLHWFAAP